MTKMAHGPSLPQVRGSNTNTNGNSNTQHHQHNHRHLHSHIRPRYHHHHDHSGDNEDDVAATNHIRSHEKQQPQQQVQPHQRDVADLESNLITEVVQTVSVVQVVDGSGSPIDVKTYYPSSAAKPDTPDAGLTAAASPAVDPAATTAALPSNDDALPSETAADSSAASQSLSSLSGSESVTSAPSSTFTSFPSLSGAYNSTCEYKRSPAPFRLERTPNGRVKLTKPNQLDHPSLTAQAPTRCLPTRQRRPFIPILASRSALLPHLTHHLPF